MKLHKVKKIKIRYQANTITYDENEDYDSTA